MTKNTLPEYWHYAKIDLFDNSDNDAIRKFSVKINYAPKSYDGQPQPMSVVMCKLNAQWRDVTTKIKTTSGADFRNFVKSIRQELLDMEYRFVRANGVYTYKSFGITKQKGAAVPQMACLIGQNPANWLWNVILLIEEEIFIFELEKNIVMKKGSPIASLQMKTVGPKTTGMTMRQMCEQAALVAVLKQKEIDKGFGAFDNSIDEDDE
jgi:hypothetical protein